MQSDPTDARPQPVAMASSSISYYADKLVLGIARHWLALFNLAWATYVILPFLAPILMQMGLTAPARIIYGIYSFTCHQLPDHSYFLFGGSPTPLQPDLEAGGMPIGLDLLTLRKFIGNAELGYKVALCERDVAIYGSVLLAGLTFSLVRKQIRPLSFKLYLIFLIPLAVDGLSQLIGLRESNWWLRTVTGALFGFASVWLAYPYLEDAMQEVIDTEQSRQPVPPNT